MNLYCAIIIPYCGKAGISHISLYILLLLNHLAKKAQNFSRNLSYYEMKGHISMKKVKKAKTTLSTGERS